MTSITNPFIFYRVDKGVLVLYFYDTDIYLFHAIFHLLKTKLLVIKNSLNITDTCLTHKKNKKEKIILKIYVDSEKFWKSFIREKTVTAKDLGYNTS